MVEFDPIRKEELRIMGWCEALRADDIRMVKELAHDGPVDTTHGRKEAKAGDFFMEFPDGTTDIVTAEEWATIGYVALPPEPTEAADGPVQLAEPVGLLQRDIVERSGPEEAADA